MAFCGHCIVALFALGCACLLRSCTLQIFCSVSAYCFALPGDRRAVGDKHGNTTQITRDALGRPTEARRSATHITRYSWDQGGSASQVGYLGKIEDPSGSTTYERDPYGRITGKTQVVNDNPNGPSSFETRYSYQGGGLVGIGYPSGLQVWYRRSASGQISGIDVQAAGRNKPVVPFISGLTYSALGQPKAWSWSNGDAASRSFDADGRMSSNEFASYRFDAASRITALTQNLWASRLDGTTGAVSLYTTPLSWAAGKTSFEPGACHARASLSGLAAKTGFESLVAAFMGTPPQPSFG